mgnify:CR=1 FL=1
MKSSQRASNRTFKSDYRKGRNFLKGVVGDETNALLAAAALNFKRVMNLWRTEASNFWQLIQNFILNICWNSIAQ